MPLTDLWCVCVWRVGWGCERERERRETGGLRWSSSVGQKRGKGGNFPGGPVVRVPHFHCGGQGWILGWELRFLQPLSLGQLKERN